MNYVEVRESMICAIEHYMRTTYFGWFSMHGADGKARAALLLTALPKYSDMKVTILLYALLQSKAHNLKIIVSRWIINAGVFAEEAAQLMQEKQSYMSLDDRYVYAATYLIHQHLQKTQELFSARQYMRLINALNEPYGITEGDIAAYVLEIFDN
jgi:hypothetical protein